MKSEKRSIKKRIKGKIELSKQMRKISERQRLRTSGKFKPINVGLMSKNDIRLGAKFSTSNTNLKQLSLEYNKNTCNMVGVLIVNLNNLQLTKNCIDSLKKQINTNFKIHLFDQNSDEQGTIKYLDQCEKNNILVYRNSENVPLNYLWNNFRNVSDCEYLCFLNNDVVVSNTFIDDTIKILDSESTVGAVIHISNNPNHLKAKNCLKYKIFIKQPLYQGWDFTMRRTVMPEIPAVLQIFGGDDYIFAKINTLGYKIAIAYSSPIIHYKEKTRVKIPNIREIQIKDATNFINLIKIEKLQQIDSTMNHGISPKFPQPNMVLTQNKNCVFTALIGDYDELVETNYPKLLDWDYICFTDNIEIKSDFWRVIYVGNETNDYESNIKLARYYKTNFQVHLSSYNNLIWMDARITIIADINKYLRYLNDKDIVFLKHPNALSILKEFDRVSGKIEKLEMIEKIKHRYTEHGYDYKNGLVSSGVLLFKNNEKTIKFFKEWWYEIKNYSHRDQLSANFVLWKNPELKYIMLSGILNLQYFKQRPRNTKPFRYE